ncbi:MAG: hypothetical protein L0H75_08120 [Nitrosospira sp.]|nr:hypothetical protein [Nitrosospira sp.]MDN5936128.1 hypothetical protein [Nitrosospira sp.]
MRQPLPLHLIKKENREDRKEDAERCQRQALKTDSVGAAVGIDFVMPLIAIGLSRAYGVYMHDVRERMRRLKDRNE